ncbi:MAG: sulfite exporter TauE/SafE family protein, partial [Burkholderiales bacterium]
MEWWFAYLLIGAVVGFLAGLLGIGGGMIIVPLLVFVFSAKGFPEAHLMHAALGTAMATILFTSFSSVRAHHRHEAVDWKIVRAMAPGILIGGFAAPAIAAQVPTRPLAMFFTAFMFYAAAQMFFRVQPKATRELPGSGGLFVAGGVIGILSSVLAAGGAFLSIPFMTWCKVTLRRER